MARSSSGGQTVEWCSKQGRINLDLDKLPLEA